MLADKGKAKVRSLGKVTLDPIFRGWVKFEL